MPCFDSKKLKKQRPPEVPKSEWSQKKQLDPAGPQDLVAKEVHVCICDAQYMRNEVAWDEKYTGVRCDFKTWRQGDPKKSTLNFPEIHQRQKEAWSCVDEQNMTQYLWLTLVPCVIEVIYRSCFLNALRVEASLIVLTFRSKGAPR